MGPIGQVKKLSRPKVNWLDDHWRLSQKVGSVKSVKTQTHPFWLHAKWLFKTMQSHGRSHKLRRNPHLDSVGSGEGLTRATTREGEQFPRNNKCDHSKMAPSEVVQCMEHAPMKGIKIHCANNHIQLMSWSGTPVWEPGYRIWPTGGSCILYEVATYCTYVSL